MKSVLSKAFLFLAAIVIMHFEFTMADTTSKALSNATQPNLFAADLFSVILNNKSTENIVYSPASIQTSLTLAFVGAEGITEEEMRKVLRLGNGDKEHVLKRYSKFIKRAFQSKTPLDNAPQLKMANRIYVNNMLKLAPTFNEIAHNYLKAEAENVDFRNNQEAVMKINEWVEQQTDHKIKDILEADAVDADTSVVLLNAIYFKGKWLHPFNKFSTKISTFHMNNKRQVEVDLMYQDDDFRYVELPELDAKALEMPYENSDISMMIILPNQFDGLERLETKLRGLNLNDISSKMSLENVDVFIPKFRIEYNIDLNEPLIEMGLKSIFDRNANFSGLLVSSESQMISKVTHKAYLDVNEGGSEATAATVSKIAVMSLNLNKKEFRADHPFAFAIRSKNAVYFAGHVTKF